MSAALATLAVDLRLAVACPILRGAKFREPALPLRFFCTPLGAFVVGATATEVVSETFAIELAAVSTLDILRRRGCASNRVCVSALSAFFFSCMDGSRFGADSFLWFSFSRASTA